MLEFLADCQILASVWFHGYGISFTGTLSRSIKVVYLATHQIRSQTMGYSHMGFSQCAVQNRAVFFFLPLRIPHLQMLTQASMLMLKMRRVPLISLNFSKWLAWTRQFSSSLRGWIKSKTKQKISNNSIRKLTKIHQRMMLGGIQACARKRTHTHTHTQTKTHTHNVSRKQFKLL